MNKNQAVKEFTNYLKEHQIPYHICIDNGCMQVNLALSAENAPDRFVESCIWFYSDGNAEARCYYSSLGADICKKSDYRGALFRLLNFINARVFLNCGDGSGCYEPCMLYTPRIYMTEDGCCDLTITTIINYDFWEVAPLETADYLTAYCPELLNKLSVPVFCVLVGKITAEEGIAYIEKNILN